MASQAQDVLGNLRKSIEENIVISKDAEGKIKISENITKNVVINIYITCIPEKVAVHQIKNI